MSYKLIMFIVLIIISQQLITYNHIKYITKEYNEFVKKHIGKSGYIVGYGKEKPILRKMKPGVIYIIVIDENDNIVDANKLQGFSIFSRFHRDNELIGKTISDVEKNQNSYDSALFQAINNILKYKINEINTN